MQGSLVAAKDTSTKRTGGHWGRDRRRSSVSNTAELALVVQCARHLVASFRETAARSFLSWIYGPSESQSVTRYICAVPVATEFMVCFWITAIEILNSVSGWEEFSACLHQFYTVL
jgi:hypothetical protein